MPDAFAASDGATNAAPNAESHSGCDASPYFPPNAGSNAAAGSAADAAPRPSADTAPEPEPDATAYL